MWWKWRHSLNHGIKTTFKQAFFLSLIRQKNSKTTTIVVSIFYISDRIGHNHIVTYWMCLFCFCFRTLNQWQLWRVTASLSLSLNEDAVIVHHFLYHWSPFIGYIVLWTYICSFTAPGLDSWKILVQRVALRDKIQKRNVLETMDDSDARFDRAGIMFLTHLIRDLTTIYTVLNTFIRPPPNVRFAPQLP